LLGVPPWQVFGFSKDFCMSGFRVGCVYTRNATLLQAMSNVAYFPAASNLTQHALTALLEDTQFIVRRGPYSTSRTVLPPRVVNTPPPPDQPRPADWAVGLAQDSFVAQNCARMGGAYTLLEQALTQAGLKFTRAEGAMFCCVDLSEYLKDATFEAERELFQALFDTQRLLMTPGKDCHFASPGNFRICWAAVPKEALPAAVARLGNFLKTWNSDQFDC
jgi:aspartate/methionine/tyrosine aminotransferase